jgi:CHAT domain-containing protein
MGVSLVSTVTGLPGKLDASKSLHERKRRLDDLTRLLHRAVIGPFARSMNDVGVRSLTFVTTGLTALLPLHAAQDDEGRCALDAWDVAFVPSARVLRQAQRAAEARTKYPSAFVGVAPDSSLTCSGIAVRRAAHLFRGRGATRVVCEPLAHAALLSAMRDASVILLFTHGVFSATAPWESALSLGDGMRTTMRQLQQGGAAPRACLVVLSACESAITDYAVMPTEAAGLGAAFLALGVPAVIGSVWKVEELSTCLLVSRLLEHVVEGHGPSAALHMAQRWLRDSSPGELLAYCEGREVLRETPFVERVRLRIRRCTDLERPFSHPFYWAGFVLLGLGSACTQTAGD